MAQDLGLHLQSKVYQTAESGVEETLSQLWYDEYKRRLWIKLFSWDRLYSPTHLVASFLIQVAIWPSP